MKAEKKLEMKLKEHKKLRRRLLRKLNGDNTMRTQK